MDSSDFPRIPYEILREIPGVFDWDESNVFGSSENAEDEIEEKESTS